MEIKKGRRVSDVSRETSLIEKGKLERLLLDLAAFFAQAWTFADTLEQPDAASLQCEGKIGKTIVERLRLLEIWLPSRKLRLIASSCRERFEKGGLSQIPVVLTHGDLIPSNMLVDDRSWKLSGLVDWAEAEYLPFGMSLYCVDHLLCTLRRTRHGGQEVVWRDDAEQLRRIFWSQLSRLIPALANPTLAKGVSLSRDIGVLLWHGIAFDDGKLDRVVEPDKDDEDLAYLSSYVDIAYLPTVASL